WRRDTFAPDGTLVRIQFIDRESREARNEVYLRSDGRVGILHQYRETGDARTLHRIVLLDKDGHVKAEFSSMDQWVEHWLEEIVSRACSDVLFVIDKNRIYLKAAMRLRQRMGVFDDVFGKQRRLAIVPIVHAVHTQGTGGQGRGTVMSAPTNTNYQAILENPGCADAIVAGTRTQREDIETRYHATNVFAIPHAFTQIKSVGVSDRACDRVWNRIVCVGRYSKEKNLGLAIEIFAQVHRQHPDARLEFYGAGAQREAMIGQTQLLGMESVVKVNDYADDIATIYATAGLSILTSSGEGFPLSIMESLSGGCPVVAFDVRYGPADMIEHGKSGFLIPPGEDDAFAKSMDRLLADRAMHKQMSRDAMLRANQFSASNVESAWRGLLVDRLDLNLDADIR
ncbi:MAG: glycosyltransferase, partial [Pirellulaceae bacterium]